MLLRGPGKVLRSASKPRLCHPSLHWNRQQTQSSKAERFVQHIDPESLPRGFVVASTFAGVKRAISPTSSSAMPSVGVSAQTPKPDVSLIVSSVPASIAGVFTTNVFQAAPVVHAIDALQTSREAFLPSQGPRSLAILANSGCANAVTGQEGLEDTRELLDLVRMELTPAITQRKAADSDALMLSTGVIGVRLPKGVIKRAIQHLVHGQVLQSNPDAWLEAARAYMTTDSFPKLRTRSFTLGNRNCHLLGIDKGAGMIHPNMSSPQGLHATLLGVMLTDAPIEPATLQTCLARAIKVSFNCISVDGDMSTNDTILAMANGQAPEVQNGDSNIPRGSEISESSHPELVAVFQQELTALCVELAHLIVRDGEGAEKFVQVRVRGAVDYEQAHAIASSISTSALVKCAMHGEDANWGRILCAAGYAKRPKSDWAIQPEKVNVSFVPPKGVRGVRAVPTLINGTPQDVDEAAAAKLLALEDICLEVDLQGGTYDKTQATAEAVYWTCDFSKEYITVSAENYETNSRSMETIVHNAQTIGAT